MSVMRLEKVGGNTIDFDPSRGYSKPDILEVQQKRAKGGKLFTYKFYYKRRWEIPVVWFSTSNANIVNDFWSNQDQIKFYPDLISAPSTYYTVLITNKTRPLDTFSGIDWETYYSGTLDLEEI